MNNQLAIKLLEKMKEIVEACQTVCLDSHTGLSQEELDENNSTLYHKIYTMLPVIEEAEASLREQSSLIDLTFYQASYLVNKVFCTFIANRTSYPTQWKEEDIYLWWYKNGGKWEIHIPSSNFIKADLDGSILTIDYVAPLGNNKSVKIKLFTESIPNLSELLPGEEQSLLSIDIDHSNLEEGDFLDINEETRVVYVRNISEL
jgi:hypothetical protein